jgi:hypothetical protein
MLCMPAIAGVARLFCSRANFQNINSSAGRKKKFQDVLSHFRPKRPQFQAIYYQILSRNIFKFCCKGLKKSLAGHIWSAGRMLYMPAIVSSSFSVEMLKSYFGESSKFSLLFLSSLCSIREKV